MTGRAPGGRGLGGDGGVRSSRWIYGAFSRLRPPLLGLSRACWWRCLHMEALVASIVTAAVAVVVELVIRELLEVLRPRRAAALSIV